MSWDLYERRLLFRGETKRDRNINTIKRNIEIKMPDNPAFKSVIVNDEYSIALTFFSTDYTNEKRFSTVHEGETVNIGDIILWNELHWLVVEIDFDDDVKRGGKMVQCNREISWQNTNTGEIITRWCLAEKPYSSNLRDGFMVDTSKREYKVQVPYDEETILVDLDKRFLLEKINGVPKAYRVTSVDVNTNKYQDVDGGFIVWNLVQDQYNEATDNKDVMIADYVPIDNYWNDDDYYQEIIGCNISGPERILYPCKEVRYAVTYVDDNADETCLDEFDFELTGVDPSYYRAEKEGNHVVVELIDRRCVNKTFELIITPLSTEYSPVKKFIKVGALL